MLAAVDIVNGLYWIRTMQRSANAASHGNTVDLYAQIVRAIVKVVCMMDQQHDQERKNPIQVKWDKCMSRMSTMDDGPKLFCSNFNKRR